MPNPYLSAIRAAHVERIEAAHERRIARAQPEDCTIPSSLISAGCWLVQNGFEGDACAAEKANGWGPARYRQYLAALSPDAAAEELEDGRKALFEGRHPIFVERLGELAA